MAARNNTQVAVQAAAATVAATATPFTGKYTGKTAKLGGHTVVPTFKYSAMLLHCNTAPNTAPQKPTTVMGKVYALVKAAGPAGITGQALVQQMLQQQWVGHPSAYVAGGMVCPLWCIGYVVGACSNKHKHLVASQPKAQA